MKAKKILVTGATGNVGSALIHYLHASNSEFQIIAAVRNVDEAKTIFADYPNLAYRLFDFENAKLFEAAFRDIDLLFLLRPPQLSQVDEVFHPLLASAGKNEVKNLVFLSVQGAEKNKFIPHNKIERLIQKLGFNFIFVRPSYFMQNLTTALLPELLGKKTITLPAGRAKFNWVDVKNIGEATAALILEFEAYHNQSVEITGTENRDFYEVSELLTTVLGERIRYKSINPISFYFKKRKEGTQPGFAIVMTLIHFLARFQQKQKVSGRLRELTGREPTRLKEFMEREKDTLGDFPDEHLE